MNIVIYSNCHGGIISAMFKSHIYTKDKFIINHVINYENLDKKMDLSHKYMLETCDVFLYQPFNKQHSYSEYDINELKKYLKPDCIILKINYYRFKGFWFESEHKPYNSYNNYNFAHDEIHFGIHKSFINFNGNKEETIEKINNTYIDEIQFLKYFREELDNFKKIDDNSDVKMYEYFIKNYENKSFFHDGFHPTNLFFYEIFRQIVFKLTGYELITEDIEFINLFNNNELTHWALPILPPIKNILSIKTPNIVYVFYDHQKKCMSVYDYYYIRLSQKNFQEYLNEI